MAKIKEQRRMSEEKFLARMKQHKIKAEERVAEDRELTNALARPMSYAMERIMHERKTVEHEERRQRLEENSSNDVLIFDDIDRRLVEMGAGPANEAPQGDDLDPNVTTRGPGKKSVRVNPEIFDRAPSCKRLRSHFRQLLAR